MAERDESFDFDEWSRSARFDYPEHAIAMLSRCGSPAEAHLIRRLFSSEETVDAGAVAWCRGVKIQAQVRCLAYSIDFTAETDRCRLAIEIDGGYHTATRAQIAADYVRERRIVRTGYLLLRFTGSEAINGPALVWREVFATLAAWRRVSRSA